MHCQGGECEGANDRADLVPRLTDREDEGPLPGPCQLSEKRRTRGRLRSEGNTNEETGDEKRRCRSLHRNQHGSGDRDGADCRDTERAEARHELAAHQRSHDADGKDSRREQRKSNRVKSISRRYNTGSEQPERDNAL